MRSARKLFYLFIVVLCFSCNNKKKSESIDIGSAVKTPVINYSVTNSFLHNDSLFTEGFLVHNGQLFESTGSPDALPQTKSLIGVNDLLAGKFRKKIELDKRKYFGEGISFFKNNFTSLLIKINYASFMMQRLLNC